MLKCPRCGREFSLDVAVCPHDHTPLQADQTIADVPLDPLLGRVFEGKYRLDQILGGGGMGTVYKATHLLIDRPVALKVLSQRFVGDQTAQQRFRREARAAGRMQHPNAVTVTDFGATEDGYLYIVMELLQGRTLRDLLAHEAPLDPARAVSFMLQTCAAVGAAHEAGLIHRDLKPANIFIEQRANVANLVKVLDFGVAKFAVEEHDDDYNTLTQVGAIIGTPRYMSPEQCSGVAPLTPASDVYSLGIILYEMLTGMPPFSADTPLALALKQVSEAPLTPRELVPSIPLALERVVMHALAKHPQERPRDANDLRLELYATAEALGFEHAESNTSPTLEELRSAGTESPSGRLVIDLATLRQVHASGERAAPALRKDGGSKDGKPARRERPAQFDRVNVPLAARQPRRAQIAVASGVLLIALIGAGILGIRWWRGTGTPLQTGVNANVTTPSGSPAAAATATATATPTPKPTPENRPANHPSPKQEKPSRIKRVLNKIKGIFG
jgi:serine/threonine-protein kinase